MSAESTEREQEVGGAEGTPLCLRCLRPADPRIYYCPYCGEATGRFTTYIPFVDIPWQTRIWGQAWRQVWSHEVSIPGRLLRLLMILWQAPILLIVGLPLTLWHWGEEQEEHPPAAQLDDEDDSASEGPLP